MVKDNKTKGEPKDAPGQSTKYDYVLKWIEEVVEVRSTQNRFIERAIDAYQGKPSRNRYKETIAGYVKQWAVHDQSRAKEIEQYCSEVPDKGSMAVFNAVDAVTQMAMGGVGQYEFGPYDPEMKQDSKVVDKLSAAAKFFYDTNKVDSVVPPFVDMAVLCGASYMHLNKKKDRKTQVTLLSPDQMLTDPKRMKTNFQRFRGHHQRASFQDVKSRVRKAKGGGYVLKTLNEAEVYVSQIRQELNGVLDPNTVHQVEDYQLRKDVDIFYRPLTRRIEERKKEHPDYMYDGDEIEIAFLYDHMNDMYFEIVNRRYVIVAKKNPLRRTNIKCTYYDNEGEQKETTKEVRLDDPYIELPYKKRFWSTYPISPLFLLLDDFDDLCAAESVLEHNLSVMGPLTFVGQSSDAEKVSRTASVAGEIVEGLPQTFGVLNKTHDITPTVTQIQRKEEKIKRALKAVDPFELQAILGDRATAKEVVSASGQVSQGINEFLANIESAMAELGDKFIKMELILNSQDTYSFTHNGKYGEIETQDGVGQYEVRAKLLTRIKLEQEANSRKALELIQYLGQLEAVEKKQFLGTMIPIVLAGLVNRQQAEGMVTEQYRPMPDEVIAAIKRRAEEEANKDPVDKLDLSGYTDEDIDSLMMEMLGGGGMDEGAIAEDPNMVADGGADPSIAAVVDGGGLPPEDAGIVANDQVGLGYV